MGGSSPLSSAAPALVDSAEALPLFGETITVLPAEKFGRDDIEIISAFSDTSQIMINRKLQDYLKLYHGRPDYDQEMLAAYDELIEEGLCFAYSLCFISMKALGKLDWWFSALMIISSWDGKAESLDDIYAIPEGGRPIRMRELFERMTQYLLYHRNHILFSKHLQRRILTPHTKSDFPYFELSGTEKDAEGKPIVKRIQDIRNIHHRFDAASLDEVLDESCLAGQGIILSGSVNVAPYTLRHAISVVYDAGEWYVCDADKHLYMQTENKEKAIQSILETFAMGQLDRMTIINMSGPVVLSAKLREFAGFAHFLKSWQEGIRLDECHQYLLHPEEIKAEIDRDPAAVDTFFQEAFELLSPIQELSTAQRFAAIDCFTSFKDPSPAVLDLMYKMLMSETVVGKKLIDVIAQTNTALFQCLLKHLPLSQTGLILLLKMEDESLITQMGTMWTVGTLTSSFLQFLMFLDPKRCMNLLKYDCGDHFLKLFSSKNPQNIALVKRFFEENPGALPKIRQHFEAYCLQPRLTEAERIAAREAMTAALSRLSPSLTVTSSAAATATRAGSLVPVRPAGAKPALVFNYRGRTLVKPGETPMVISRL